MFTVSPEPQHSQEIAGWLKLAFLDEPEARSLYAFICELTATRELHDALRVISEEVRAFLEARFVAVVVFEEEEQVSPCELTDPAAISVPLRVGGRNTGQVTVYFDQARALLQSEARVMEVIAAVAAVTLDNARHLQRERKRLTQAEAVNNLAPRIVVSRTREELGRLVVSALKDRLHYDAARLLWRNGEGGLIYQAANGGHSNGQTADQIWEDGGTALRVLREGSALIVGDQADGQEASPIGGKPTLRSLVAVPVRGSLGIQGVLEVGSRCPRALDTADLGTLTALAAQVAAIGEHVGPQVPDSGKSPQEPDRARNDVLSVIVHDLRGPLSLVKGYVSTMLRRGDSLDKDKRQRFLMGIDEAADRLSTMVDHLSGVSRLESGQFPLKLNHVDLAQLVSETVERLRTKLGEHPISLELPGEVLPVYVDSEQISRVLGYLLSNAAQQSPVGGRITIRITGHSSHVKAGSPSAATRGPQSLELRGHSYGVVEVRDEGAGIPREYLSKVFDKFFRLPGNKARKRGSGFELYVAKKIAEAHGGRVGAESEPGQGSTLSFWLPLSVSGESSE